MEHGTGYRFHPSDEELVNHYLKLKMLGQDDKVYMIPEINLLKLEPWEIPEMAMKMSNNSNDKVWYFFCAPSFKYCNCNRVDRKTKAGYWKVTGKDRKVADIGTKKTLVFYRRHASNGVKTNWVMHQYNATFDFPTKSNFFVCKLKEKEDSEDNPASELEHGQSSAYAGNQSSENNPTQDVSHEMQACMQSFHGYEEMDYTISTLHSSGRIRTIIMIIKTDLVP